MKISTEIGSLSKIVGEEKAVEYVARAGFDAWDFSLGPMCNLHWRTKTLLHTYHPLAGPDFLKLARRLKQIASDNGIECNQSHAPNYTTSPEVCSYLKRCIECTAEVGGKICVIHPKNDATAQENAEFYRELLPFAKECGVKIATENMWNWDDEKDEASPAACSSHDDFKAHLDAVDDDFLVACVDIGHSEMRGLQTNAVKMIEHLGDKVQALHIHDNDKHIDSHEIPFSMDIDYIPVLKALKKINYNGYFTLEAYQHLSNSFYGSNNVFEGVKNLADSARKLADIYESIEID